MFENRFDEAMDEVSTVHGLNWNDASKIALFARFLEEDAKFYDTFARFEKFLERQADEELTR